MSDYEKAMADRAERIDALRKRIAGTLPEELIGGFSLNGLTLEIGCGHGHFLASYGAAFPQENCIGINLITNDGELTPELTPFTSFTKVAEDIYNLGEGGEGGHQGCGRHLQPCFLRGLLHPHRQGFA